MAEEPNRKATELGSRSPASEEAKEQGASGQRGGPREGRTPDMTPDQPAQASGRRGEQHEDPPQERKSFAPGQAPSEHGEGKPGPEQIARNQQGIGRQSGSRSAHGERQEEEAQRGGPQEGHTRAASHGRQSVPGQGQRPE
ncbi:MAG: hypothetical protein ACR2H9_07800 [Longimicrobiaceae bacterium]